MKIRSTSLLASPAILVLDTLEMIPTGRPLTFQVAVMFLTFCGFV